MPANLSKLECDVTASFFFSQTVPSQNMKLVNTIDLLHGHVFLLHVSVNFAVS